MPILRFVRSFSAGLLIGLFIVGLLPFLLIYSWVEFYGLTELYVSPLFMINKLFRDQDEERDDLKV